MDSLYFFIYSSSPPCAMDERAPRTYVVRMIAVNDREKKKNGMHKQFKS